MSKDLLYRPDLSYDKSYHTDGTIYSITDDDDINGSLQEDHFLNRLDTLDELRQEIISKLPVVPDDLLKVFLPPFISINDLLKDIIEEEKKKPQPPKPEPEPDPDPIPYPEPMPDPDPIPGTLPPDDPFGIEIDIYIGVNPQIIPEDEEVENTYKWDITDIIDDYLKKFNDVLDKYLVNVMTSLSLSEHSNLKLIATKDLKNKDLSHVSDYLTKSKIGLNQQLKLYYKMFDMDESIFHLRSVKVAKEQLKRYKKNKRIQDSNALTKSANDLLKESIMVAEKKYEENFYGLYKYLNSSVILFNECTNTTVKQKQALILLNNKEREK